MGEMRKWDEERREYAPYAVPDDWKVLCHSWDLDEECNCARCGKPMRFGDTYTSLQLHTPGGLGYGVCGECYFGIEMPARRAAEGMTA